MGALEKVLDYAIENIVAERVKAVKQRLEKSLSAIPTKAWARDDIEIETKNCDAATIAVLMKMNGNLVRVMFCEGESSSSSMPGSNSDLPTVPSAPESIYLCLEETPKRVSESKGKK